MLISGPSYEVDGVATPLLAYAFHQLTVSYAGPLCKLREDAGNTTMDFYPQSDGTFPAAAATAFANGANLFVVTLYDQGSAGNNATQAVLANQPRFNFTDAALNSRPSMSFSGAQALGTVSAPPSIFGTGGVASIVYVVPATPGAGSFPTLAFRSEVSIFVAAAGFEFGGDNGSWRWSLGRGTAGRGVAFMYAYDGSSLSNVPIMYATGTQQMAGFAQVAAPTTVLTEDGVIVIGNNAVTGGNQAYTANVAEIVLWNSSISSADRVTVHGRLTSFYGTA